MRSEFGHYVLGRSGFEDYVWGDQGSKIGLGMPGLQLGFEGLGLTSAGSWLGFDVLGLVIRVQR